MLVKEGHKKSYIIFGILQLLLAVACIALLLPYMLKDCGVTVQKWVEFADKVKNLSFGKYIFAGFNFIPLVLFIITALSLMFRRSGASIFVKVASIVAIFPIACKGIEYGIFALTSKAINLTDFFKNFTLILFIASVVLFVIGLIFQFSVSKTSTNKSNAFQITKALFWIIVFGFNFVFADLLEKSVWIKGLLGYPDDSLPYFLCWMLLILGILELVCSSKTIEAKNSKIGVSTSYQTSQSVTTNYVPASQESGMAANPVVPNITINQTFQGIPQGLENEGNSEEAQEGAEGIGENLESETNGAQEEKQEKPKTADYNEDSGLLAHKNMEERTTESYLEKLEKLTEKLAEESQDEKTEETKTEKTEEEPEKINPKETTSQAENSDEKNVEKTTSADETTKTEPVSTTQATQTETMTSTEPASEPQQKTETTETATPEKTEPVTEQPAPEKIAPAEPISEPKPIAPAEPVTQEQTTPAEQNAEPQQKTEPAVSDEQNTQSTESKTTAPAENNIKPQTPTEQVEQAKKPRGRPKKVSSTDSGNASNQ
ncbi:MAG: hypothetical protein IJ837_01305 [Clostridia bacterium]|nr:hypothetical protein [Clostridia bacterium]